MTAKKKWSDVRDGKLSPAAKARADAKVAKTLRGMAKADAKTDAKTAAPVPKENAAKARQKTADDATRVRRKAAEDAQRAAAKVVPAPKPVVLAPLDDEPTSVTSGRFLATLRHTDPARWAAVIRHALRSAGYVKGAAVALGIQRKTLQRWLTKKPALRDGIDLVRHGQHPKPAAKT